MVATRAQQREKKHVGTTAVAERLTLDVALGKVLRDQEQPYVATLTL